jgi:hypothetical protein
MGFVRIKTCFPSRRNRRLIGKNRKKRDFLGLPIFSKKKIAIFWSEKKARFFEKIGKKAAKIGKKRDKEPDSFFFHSVWSSKGRSLWRPSSIFEVCKGRVVLGHIHLYM